MMTSHSNLIPPHGQASVGGLAVIPEELHPEGVSPVDVGTINGYPVLNYYVFHSFERFPSDLVYLATGRMITRQKYYEKYCKSQKIIIYVYDTRAGNQGA
jgi:hypothetical protein